MKKIIVIILGILVIVFVGILVAINSINETVTKDDLPQTVYESSNPSNGAQSALQSFFSLNGEDDYSYIEQFMNYMIYDSIKENLNDTYNPLGECETDACNYIMVTDFATVDYSFVTLNEEDQIVLTVSAKRFSFPTVDTAVHLVFDLTVNHLETSFTLTLNHAKIADKTVSMSVLDFMMSYVDTASIEDSVTFGTLDLENYTYTVSLTSLALFTINSN